MKKYLLTSLLGVFGLVGAFASAESISFTFDGGDNDGYTPKGFVLTIDSSFSSDNFTTTDSCEGGCAVGFYSDEDYDPSTMSCYFEIYGDSIDGYDCDSLTSGIYYVGRIGGAEMPVANFTLTSDDITLISNDVGESGGAGGNLTPIISGGNNMFSGIITGLNSTIDEFLPYLVYIGLGLITSIIGFIAIRWLVNRTQAKIRGTFSSGRRRK